MRLLIKIRINFALNTDYGGYEWREVIPKIKDDGALHTKYKNISESLAKSIIEKDGLVLVASDDKMKIYDTPSMDFRAEYRGRIIVDDTQ